MPCDNEGFVPRPHLLVDCRAMALGLLSRVYLYPLERSHGGQGHLTVAVSIAVNLSVSVNRRRDAMAIDGRSLYVSAGHKERSAMVRLSCERHLFSALQPLHIPQNGKPRQAFSYPAVFRVPHSPPSLCQSDASNHNFLNRFLWLGICPASLFCVPRFATRPMITPRSIEMRYCDSTVEK